MRNPQRRDAHAGFQTGHSVSLKSISSFLKKTNTKGVCVGGGRLSPQSPRLHKVDAAVDELRLTAREHFEQRARRVEEVTFAADARRTPRNGTVRQQR